MSNPTLKYNIIYWPTTKKSFDDVGKVVKYACEQKGIDVTITNNIDTTKVNIIFGANLCVYNNNYEWTKIFPKNTIIVNLEQLAAGAWSHDKYLTLLKRFKIWDYSDSNIEWLKRNGIDNVSKMTIGYSPALSIKIEQVVLTEIGTGKKDVDVLFYGALNSRRMKILNNLLLQEGLLLFYSDKLEGIKRDIMISRAKIVINIHFYPKNVFEIVRVSHLLSNKSFVISEIPDSKEEYEYWKDAVIFSKYDDIVDNVMKYIKDEEARNTIAERGFEIIKSRPFSLPE